MINLALLSISALATQTQPAQDLEGSWELACTDASITVQLGLVATVGGLPFALDDEIVIDVVCGVDGPEATGIARDLYGSCRSAGIPHGPCRDLTRDVRSAVLDLSDAVSPVEMALEVQEWDAFGQWFGIYPGTVVATFADGRDEQWPVIVDNNDGAGRGTYAGFGIGVLDGASTANLGCIAVGAGSVGGRVDPAVDSATLAVDAGATLICAADLGGGDIMAGDIAVAISVDAQ